jgi:hypothetical protein
MCCAHKEDDETEWLFSNVGYLLPNNAASVKIDKLYRIVTEPWNREVRSYYGNLTGEKLSRTMYLLDALHNIQTMQLSVQSAAIICWPLWTVSQMRSSAHRDAVCCRLPAVLPSRRVKTLAISKLVQERNKAQNKCADNFTLFTGHEVP